MQVLRKRPTINVHGCNGHTGLSDIAFPSNDNSRLVKSPFPASLLTDLMLSPV